MITVAEHDLTEELSGQDLEDLVAPPPLLSSESAPEVDTVPDDLPPPLQHPSQIGIRSFPKSGAWLESTNSLLASIERSIPIDRKKCWSVIETGWLNGLRPARALLDANLVNLLTFKKCLTQHVNTIKLSTDMVDNISARLLGIEELVRLNTIPIRSDDTGGITIITVAVSEIPTGMNSTELNNLASSKNVQLEYVVADRKEIIAAKQTLNRLRTATRTLTNDATTGDTVQTSRAAQQADVEAQERWTALVGAADYEANVIHSLLTECLARNASDIHIQDEIGVTGVSCDIYLRILGKLRFYKSFPIKTGRVIANRFRAAGGLDGDLAKPVSGRYDILVPDLGSVDMRIESLPIQTGSMMVIRLLYQVQGGETTDISALFPDNESNYRKMMSTAVARSDGMVLLAGRTGDGKTTTLAALLSQIAASRTRKIVSAENPVEYRLPGVQQVHVTKQMTFANALRSFLRCDPDVIMLGEIRDSEVCKEAISAVRTGHLVLSTVHAVDAASTPLRLMDMLPDPSDHMGLADSISLIVSQRLLRTLCTHCAVGDVPYLEVNPSGCSQCDSGWKGRMAIAELLDLSNNPEARKAITKGVSPTELREISGMPTFMDHAQKALEAGRTTPEEVWDKFACLPEGMEMPEHRKIIV